MRDLVRLAQLGGKLLTDRRNVIERLAHLPHKGGMVPWADVMAIVLAAEEDFYDADGTLKPDLRSLAR